MNIKRYIHFNNIHVLYMEQYETKIQFFDTRNLKGNWRQLGNRKRKIPYLQIENYLNNQSQTLAR